MMITTTKCCFHCICFGPNNNVSKLENFQINSKIFLFFLLGPKLPFKLHGCTMVSSPTETGVLVIGGKDSNQYSNSNIVMELSGNSKTSLHWTILEQNLKYPCVYHVSFLISNQIAQDLKPEFNNNQIKVVDKTVIKENENRKRKFPIIYLMK